MNQLIKSSSSDKTYTVKIDEQSGYKSCTCPHWQYRLRLSKGKCKHIDEANRRIEAKNWIESQPLDIWMFDMMDDYIKPDAEEEV